MYDYYVSERYIINPKYGSAMRALANIKQVEYNNGKIYVLDANGRLVICDLHLNIMARCKHDHLDKIVFTENKRMYYGGFVYDMPVCYSELRSRNYVNQIYGEDYVDMCAYGKHVIMATTTKLTMASIKCCQIDESGWWCYTNPSYKIAGLVSIMVFRDYIYAFTNNQCYILTWSTEFRLIDVRMYNEYLLDYYSMLYMHPRLHLISHDPRTFSRSHPITLNLSVKVISMVKHYYDLLLSCKE